MEKKLLIQSDPAQLKSLRDRLSTILQQTGFDAKTREAFLVAVCEGCTNAIRHSYHGEKGHEIEVTILDEKDKITFKIRDYGEKIDLTKIKPPQIPPQQPGGLGVYFMKTIMDLVEYNTAHSRGNELTLVKYKGGQKTS